MQPIGFVPDLLSINLLLFLKNVALFMMDKSKLTCGFKSCSD